jgi:hypothetical protein
MHSLKELIRQEAARGVTKVVATFSGSGDEGQMERVEYMNGDAYMDEPEYAVELGELLEELFDSKVACDWQDNEGGGGTLEVNTSDYTFTLEAYWNEVVQRDAAAVTDVLPDHAPLSPRNQ